MTLLKNTTAALLIALTVFSGAQAAPSSPSSQNLVLAIGGEPETGFDPLLGWGSYGNPLFQSTLLRRDAELNTLPGVATSWSLSEDRLTWTLSLRDDVQFSDGSLLTAKDVAFTFNQAKAAAGELDLQVMEKAEALNPTTVEIHLKKPWITFVNFFHTLGIVPADSYGPEYARHPIGSGPFQLVAWQEGQQLIVERNPYYYGEPAAFERITFLFTGEDAGLAAANAGAAQMVSVPAQLADAVPEGFYAKSVQTVDNRGLSMPFLPPQQLDGKKVGNAVTSDLAIRKAMNLWFDRELVVDVALNGHGTPGYGPADELPWSGETAIAHDPEAAMALLDEAGWLMTDAGVRVKDGIKAAFAINYPAGDATRQALAETAAELLRPLGIMATPVGGSWDSITRVMHSEPVVFGFGSHSAYQLYGIYASSLGGVGYSNPSYYANEKVDALFEQAQSAPDAEASYPLWAEAAQQYGFAGDNAWVWLVNLDHVYFIDECLDLGETQIESHGHGWPITANIVEWRWTCQ
ncbi:ABC transporter substrate-binding protein [Marinomonas ostreistagni]|uniref:ABC transporter substrate-binding protein n=1 Tax=Marinomonas ostreistagni TaxID=359209 RepID=UPI0019513856|nr:ABC transporter substrate-binding protein [Marinomonas ostreistagni]MBM6549775.1 ABC transporter substrate-binding protein [Marinomonas ostreistagni]